MTGHGQEPNVPAAAVLRYSGLVAWTGIIAAALLVVALFMSGTASAAVPPASCPGSAVALVTVQQKVVEEVGLDMSASTSSSVLRVPYLSSVKAVVARSVSESALLRIVPFGPSGVGAQPIFLGSFAASGDDELFSLAAANKLRCIAARQLASLAQPGATQLGSDVAGFIRAAILHARSVAVAKAQVTVTVVTDGCQAPGKVGLNRRLTDVCGLLAAGRSAEEIVQQHREEFTLPDASGVTIAMRGVGVGRRPSTASTALAERLIVFWSLVCWRAHATSCLIGSDLP